MKKRWMAALAAAGVLAAANAAARKDAPADAESVSPAEYVLGEYQGRVAVFCPKQGTLPRRITAIEVGLLPAADREQLQDGIHLADPVALTMLLEDLGC